MAFNGAAGSYVLYTAVLPRYRESCLTLLHGLLPGTFIAFAGDQHLDPTVRTDVDADLAIRVTNRSLVGGRVLLQTGHWREVVQASTALLDLNPRSLTAWVLLGVRRALRRRTLLWGHLYPQNGADHVTAGLRRLMRRMASGTVTYGYESAEQARQDMPSKPVWVAPNALYAASDLGYTESQDRRRILYVGRLESSKKVDVLVDAFAASRLAEQGFRLTLVGSGAEQRDLQDLASKRGVAASVDFPGRIFSAELLRELYAESVCSVSPGYAGLQVTQSIGFGVPVLVSRDERHSPEIELVSTGAIEFFETDDAQALAKALRELASRDVDRAEREAWAREIQDRFSAEAMSQGLYSALVSLGS